MNKNKKTIAMIISFILFIILLHILFPYVDLEYFCCGDGFACPAIKIEPSILCNGCIVFYLPMLSASLFLLIMIISLIISILLAFLKKAPKFMIFVRFSSMMLPLIIVSSYGPFSVMRNFALIFIWILPILISFLSYKKSKITREKLCNRIYQWILPSLLLYPIYVFVFVYLILTAAACKSWLHVWF